MKVILVRNGETLWEKEKRLQGIQDSALSEEGKKQVEAVAQALKREQLDAVYCSDLGRCIDSARPISKSHNLKLGIRPELRQRSHGIVEGMTQKEADKEYPKLQEQRKLGKFQFKNPKGESYADAEKRLLPFLSEIRQKHAAQTICIVTHGGIIRLVLGNFLNMPPHEIVDIEAPHNGYYVIENAEQNPSVCSIVGGERKNGLIKRPEQQEEEKETKEAEPDDETIEKEAEKELQGDEPLVEGEELEIEEEPPSFDKEEPKESEPSAAPSEEQPQAPPADSDEEPPEKDDETVSPE